MRTAPPSSRASSGTRAAKGNLLTLKTMARYFKVTEIDRDSFIEAVGEDLDCAQLVTACDGIGYAAVDDTEEDEIAIPLDVFEEESE